MSHTVCFSVKPHFCTCKSEITPAKGPPDRDVIFPKCGGILERMLVSSSTRILGTYCRKHLYLARDLSAMASTKRQRDSDGEVSPPKKIKTGKENESAPKVYNRIASLHNATAVNKNPPVAQLQNVLKSVKTPNTVDPGACVVYWMRMGDLRSMSSFIAHFHFPLNSRHSQRQPRDFPRFGIRKIQQHPSHCTFRIQSSGLHSSRYGRKTD